MLSSSGLSASSFQTENPTTTNEFKTKEEYLEYISSIASLPKGFATGTAEGTFVPQEAPSIGELPIRGTLIDLTEGPSESWAAVFTKNQVRHESRF